MGFSKFDFIYQVLLSVLQGTVIIYGQNNSTTPGVAPQYVEEKSRPFPAWLIGVIVLSSIFIIGVIITIIQRILRRRNERIEQYRLQAE